MKQIILIFFAFILTYGFSLAQNINAPTQLEAQMEDPFYIKVKWNDNSNNENGFYVERATSLDSSNWGVIGWAAMNAVIFNDYWLTYGKKYYYRVYAYNETGVSGYSNIDSMVAVGDTTNYPAAPSNLSVTDITMNSITINWNDNASNELGFIIARRNPGEIYYHYIDTVQTDVLTYQEVGLTPDNIYFYKVCSYNNQGTSDFSNIVSGTTKSGTISVSNNAVLPQGYFLSDNFPNPFNPSTKLKFGIPENAVVRINIYDITGKKVEELMNQNLPSGIYEIRWNTVKFSSGIYFLRFETKDFTEMKKLTLIK